MSVMIINVETFENVAESLFFNYNYRLKGKFQDFKDVKALVTSWFELNCLSYSIRYNENVSTYGPNFEKKAEKLSNIQLLKSLECIRYNIEFDKEEEHTSVRKLEKFITLMKDIIIEDLVEYQTAQWG